MNILILDFTPHELKIKSNFRTLRDRATRRFEMCKAPTNKRMELCLIVEVGEKIRVLTTRTRVY